MVRALLILSLSILTVAISTGCGPDGDGDADGDADGDTDGDADGDGDGDADVCVIGDDVECCENADCNDGVFCNGIETCDRGICENDPSAVLNPVTGQFEMNCSDGLSCTTDLCNEAANRCVHTPDHAVCGNGDICDGEERCDPTLLDADPTTGCVAGTPLRCDDRDPCTDDFCAEGACAARVRDADGDGHGDASCTYCSDPDTCETGDDCDDSNATVYPGAEEICGDGADNNCDRYRDYADETCSITNDACSDAQLIEEGIRTFGSTRGAAADIDTACAAASDRDVAFYFVVVEESDVEITLGTTSTRVTASLTAACGDPLVEVKCSAGRDIVLPARGLVPGTYYVVVSAESEIDFTLDLAMAPATPGPDGDLCGTALPLPLDGSVETASLTGSRFDYELSCASPGDLDVVYEIDAPDGFTGDIVVSRPDGAGTVSFALQETCGVAASERRCWEGDITASARVCGLPPGTYYLVLANAMEVDYEITATPAPPVAGTHFEELFADNPTARGWTLAGQFGWGTPSGTGEPAPYDGGAIATTMNGSTYPNSMSYAVDYAETPDIDLSESCAPLLQYQAWLDTESCCDGAQLEISVEGGAFVPLEHTTLTPPYTSSQQWRGSFTTWSEYSVSLEDYVGSRIRIRFAFESDSSVVREGWFIDNVRVIEP